MADLRRSAGVLWSTVRQAEPRLAAVSLGLDLLVNVAGRPLTGLWLKLMVDGATAGERPAVVWAGIALAGSLALQSAASVALGTLNSQLHESHAR